MKVFMNLKVGAKIISGYLIALVLMLVVASSVSRCVSTTFSSSPLAEPIESSIGCPAAKTSLLA